MIFTAVCPSPLGPLLLAAEEDRLLGLWLAGQRHYAAGLPEESREDPTHPVLRAAEDWLGRYFAGERPAPGELILAPRGSEFQRLIWSLLPEIPYGETVTYGELAALAARRSGREKTAPRAVGGAVGRNPISIIIPCHRVLGAGGSLTGYAGGLERKRWLLRHEGAI
ncbi:MAG: methylated-DNA--[Oscillospiraceae bacterium]|nr:methylated-DNA--[protein]-cysteine S-methyltransferase [Oscillospiraceae bacterium]